MHASESASRSFEIPAIGAFMLAQRTAEHEYLYGDGVGAALFSDCEELVTKANYYLAHKDERLRIADTGHGLCERIGLSWQEHMAREWPLVDQVLHSGLDVLNRQDSDVPFWSGFRNGSLPSSREHLFCTKPEFQIA
jgi:hypothetical protein